MRVLITLFDYNLLCHTGSAPCVILVQ